MFLLFLQHVATHSHSHPLAISNSIWANPPLECQMKSTHFSTQIRCSHWIPRAKHNISIFFTCSLSLARSLAPNFLFCVEETAASWNETPEEPGWRLELEPLGWHVGWVEIVGSALVGLGDQGVVFLDLNERKNQTVNRLSGLYRNPICCNAEG